MLEGYMVFYLLRKNIGRILELKDFRKIWGSLLEVVLNIVKVRLLIIIDEIY